MRNPSLLDHYIVFTGSPGGEIGKEFLVFFRVNHFYVITSMRYSEERRNHIYEKFGKPFRDELVGKDVGDKIKLGELALLATIPTLFAVWDCYYQMASLKAQIAQVKASAAAEGAALKAHHEAEGAAQEARHAHQLEMQMHKSTGAEGHASEAKGSLEYQKNTQAHQIKMEKLKMGEIFIEKNFPAGARTLDSNIPPIEKEALSKKFFLDAHRAFRDLMEETFSHVMTENQLAEEKSSDQK